MFYHQELPHEQLEDLESHLAVCDECQELFLTCIEQIEWAATELVSADFPLQTMEFIRTSQRTAHSHPSAKQKRRRMLINYVAAAAVTIILMSGGVFQSAVDQTAQIPGQPSEAVHRNEQNLLFTWPEKIETSTIHWVDNMSFTKLKEVKW